MTDNSTLTALGKDINPTKQTLKYLEKHRAELEKLHHRIRSDVKFRSSVKFVSKANSAGNQLSGGESIGNASRLATAHDRFDSLPLRQRSSSLIGCMTDWNRLSTW